MRHDLRDPGRWRGVEDYSGADLPGRQCMLRDRVDAVFGRDGEAMMAAPSARRSAYAMRPHSRLRRAVGRERATGGAAPRRPRPSQVPLSSAGDPAKLGLAMGNDPLEHEGWKPLRGGADRRSRRVDRRRDRSRRDGQAVGEVPAIVEEVLGRLGPRSETGARALMEPRFGTDFGHVRVHADARAGRSAQAIRARADASGPSVVFAPGQFTLETTEGRALLAHDSSRCPGGRGCRGCPPVSGGRATRSAGCGER